VLVSGDAAYVSQARQTYAANAEAVVTKTAVTEHAAHLRPVNEVRADLTAAAMAAMLGLAGQKPWVVGSPYTVVMKLADATHVEVAAGIPGVEKIGPLTVRFVEADPERMYRLIRILYRFLSM